MIKILGFFSKCPPDTSTSIIHQTAIRVADINKEIGMIAESDEDEEIPAGIGGEIVP